jgi:hypothetical protein
MLLPEGVQPQGVAFTWWILWGPKMSQDMEIPDFLWIWMTWEPTYGTNNWATPFWGSHCIKSTWTETVGKV